MHSLKQSMTRARAALGEGQHGMRLRKRGRVEEAEPAEPSHHPKRIRTSTKHHSPGHPLHQEVVSRKSKPSSAKSEHKRGSSATLPILLESETEDEIIVTMPRRRKTPTSHQMATNSVQKKQQQKSTKSGHQHLTTVPGPTSSRPYPEYPRASLLGLPGELRNRIFRHALLSPDLILVHAGNAVQPGLVRASRQLRAEAKGIFEEENNFFVEAWDLRLRIPPNTAKHWVLELNYKISLKGNHNWANLREWLRGYYECTFRGLAEGQPTHWSRLVQRAFHQVDLLRKDVHDWPRIALTLDNWKTTSEMSGTEWD